MAGINLPIQVPVAYDTFGGWTALLFVRHDRRGRSCHMNATRTFVRSLLSGAPQAAT